MIEHPEPERDVRTDGGGRVTVTAAESDRDGFAVVLETSHGGPNSETHISAENARALIEDLQALVDEPEARTDGGTDADDDRIATRSDLAREVRDARDAADPLAAYVVGRWQRENITPEDAAEWDPMSRGDRFNAGSVDAEPSTATVSMPTGRVEVAREDLTEGSAAVKYDADGIYLHAGVEGPDGYAGGLTLTLTPEAATDLAVALYCAAWEWVNYPRAEDTDARGDERTLDDYADLDELVEDAPTAD